MSSRYCDWMRRFDKLDARFGHIPLNSLFIPGSHDSGAYVLFQNLGFAPDRPDLIHGTFLALLANLFPCIVRPFVARFSKTQNVDVSSQLECGIRYLDIRVAFDETDKSMKICHNLYADFLSIVLDDVLRFIQKFTKEIVILDFQHFHNFTTDRHMKLMKTLSQTFEGRLIPVQDGAAISLRYLWEKSYTQRVIIVYRDNIASNFRSKNLEQVFWSTDMLPNPWPDTRSSGELVRHIRQVIPKRSKDKLFVTQSVLTPNTKYSILHFFSSLRPLAETANHCIRKMMIDGEFDKADEKPGTGPNIVMIDFVNQDIVEEIVMHNITQKSKL